MEFSELLANIGKLADGHLIIRSMQDRGRSNH